ncbi:hypothetical protein ACIBCM_26505 [Streptomyces sp. NPDC051018]
MLSVPLWAVASVAAARSRTGTENRLFRRGKAGEHPVPEVELGKALSGG